MSYASGLFVTLFVYLLTSPSLIVNGYPSKDYSILSDGGEREELVKTLPKMKSKSSPTAANEGDPVTFPCEVEDLGSLSVSWIKRKQSKTANLYIGTFRSTNDERISLEKNNALVIKNVNQQDSGSYICKVSTDKDISVEHILLVHSVPTIQTDPSTRNTVLSKGQNLKLTCKSDGDQKPDIKWEKDGEKLNIKSADQETLEIPNVDRKDAGKYVCKVYSFYGSINQAEFTVTVEESPEVELPEPNIYTGIGQEVKLRCKIYGLPRPTVFFDSNRGVRLVYETKDFVEYTTNIFIREESDFGKYRCHALNKFDKATGEIEVSGRPSAPVILNNNGDFPTTGDEFELKYRVTSYSPITKILVTYRYSKDLEKFTDWNSTEIDATGSDGPNYNLKHVLQNMEKNTYEVKIYAENKYGRSEGSELYSITTDGGIEQWKMAGSSSYRIKSSKNISIITCLVILFTFCLAS